MQRGRFGIALLCAIASQTVYANPIEVRQTTLNISNVIAPSFLSFSVEFSSFPDFAGNLSQPNTFSLNLLDNIGNLTGSKPVIRVGGNTQDYALYDPNLQTALNVTFTQASQDYPTIISIGRSFFESYQTWPGVQYIHGFNLGKNGTVGLETLQATVPLACNALSNGKLFAFELGNEPDLYKTSAQGPVRPKNWTEQDYVNEWVTKTRLIKSLVNTNCSSQYGYITPSFAGVKNSLDPVRVWQDRLGQDGGINQISSHNYISGATSPGVTLQGTLMNHTRTVQSIAAQLNVSSILAQLGVPFILGETNSLYNEGAPGLSDSFGAALWGIDFNLWCAANNIARVHMHQGTNYRYAAWQPVATNKTTIGTKAPYYGSMGLAAILGNLVVHQTKIANIPLPDDREAAYLIFENDLLARVAVINMMQYSYTTVNGSVNQSLRPSKRYNFSVGQTGSGSVRIQRLLANGSDATTGITLDGRSYNYELDQGRPVVLNNITTGERATIFANGTVSVDVPWSSMAILTFMEA